MYIYHTVNVEQLILLKNCAKNPGLESSQALSIYLSIYLSLSLTHTHTLSLSLSPSHTHTLSLSLFLSLSFSLSLYIYIYAGDTRRHMHSEKKNSLCY
jgi:purine-cytosine permease-like protein